MKIKQQVCSLELAKKLKELGVKQESFFYWALRQDGSWICAQGQGWSDSISAFTVAELGEMLPNMFEYEVFKRCLIKSFKIDDTHITAIYNMDSKHLLWLEADTEADARAKMLIYLLENNLIQVK